MTIRALLAGVLVFAGVAMGSPRIYTVQGTLDHTTGTNVLGLDGGQMTVEVFSDTLTAPHYQVNVGGDLTARYQPGSAKLTLSGTAVDGAYTDATPGDIVVVNNLTLNDQVTFNGLQWIAGSGQIDANLVVEMKPGSPFPAGSDAQPLYGPGDVGNIFVTFSAKDGTPLGLYQLIGPTSAAVPEPATAGLLLAVAGMLLRRRRASGATTGIRL